MLHSERFLSGAQRLRALLKAAFLCAWSREYFFDMQVYGLVAGGSHGCGEQMEKAEGKCGALKE